MSNCENCGKHVRFEIWNDIIIKATDFPGCLIRKRSNSHNDYIFTDPQEIKTRYWKKIMKLICWI